MISLVGGRVYNELFLAFDIFIKRNLTETGTFDDVSESIENILKQILEHDYSDLHTFGNFTIDPDVKERDEEIFDKAKHFYESCKDEVTIDSRGTEPIHSLLEKFNSIWEDSKSSNLETITSAMSFLISNGAYPFFSFYGDADSKNPGINTLTLNQNGLQLPSKQYYTVPSTLELYRQTVKDVWSAIFTADDSNFFGTDHNISTAVDSLISLETALANISNTS